MFRAVYLQANVQFREYQTFFWNFWLAGNLLVFWCHDSLVSPSSKFAELTIKNRNLYTVCITHTDSIYNRLHSYRPVCIATKRIFWHWLELILFCFGFFFKSKNFCFFFYNYFWKYNLFKFKILVGYLHSIFNCFAI